MITLLQYIARGNLISTNLELFRGLIDQTLHVIDEPRFKKVTKNESIFTSPESKRDFLRFDEFRTLDFIRFR